MRLSKFIHSLHRHKPKILIKNTRHIRPTSHVITLTLLGNRPVTLSKRFGNKRDYPFNIMMAFIVNISSGKVETRNDLNYNK